METKTCTRCHEDKPLDEFGWRQKSKNIRQYQCILCMRISSAENYQRNKGNIKKRVKTNKGQHRQQYKEWKETLSCEICGESETCCLDFHHRDPSEKDGTVSKFVSSSFERVLEEAEKCAVLCANCHRKVHNNIIMLD